MVDLYDLYVQKFDEISIFRINCILKKNYIGPSSVVQWLRLCLSTAGGAGLDPWWGNSDPTYHMAWPENKSWGFSGSLEVKSQMQGTWV